MAKTSTPIVDRSTIFSSSTQLAGFISNDEVAGNTLVYVYVGTKRVGATTINAATVTLNGVVLKTWSVLIRDLSLTNQSHALRRGDTVYVQARGVGKDLSDPTRVYTVDGLDQPDQPYVQEDPSKERRDIFERDRYVSGDVPLLNGVQAFTADVTRGIPAGVSVSVYINRTYLTSVQTDIGGHWVLDTLDQSNPDLADSPLLPLSKNDIVTARATRYSVAQDGSRTEVLAPSVDSPAAEVRSGFFRSRLFDYYPAVMRTDDSSGDLKAFTQVLALGMDEMKSFVDQFTDIFAIDRCDPRYLGAIAYLLGYPLNKLDSIESQRFQVKNAAEFWKRKGTTSVFEAIFYLLDYDVHVQELWTRDYVKFYPTVMAPPLYVDPVYHDSGDNPIPPPDTAPELLENGGEWYKSPYFALVIQPASDLVPTPIYPYDTDPVACPLETNSQNIALSISDLRYLLERVNFFRPAHTVLDYLAFTIPIQECGPIPRERLETEVVWKPQEPGWYLPYCEPDDPVYYRDGLRSTRPDGKGLTTLGVTRDPAGLVPPLSVKMKRRPERGYCHPGESLLVDLAPGTSEYYYFFLNRSGLGEGFYPLGTEPIDHDCWPSRDSVDPPDRSGKYRYVDRVQVTAAPPPTPAPGPSIWGGEIVDGSRKLRFKGPRSYKAPVLQPGSRWALVRPPVDIITPTNEDNTYIFPDAMNDADINNDASQIYLSTQSGAPNPIPPNYIPLIPGRDYDAGWVLTLPPGERRLFGGVLVTMSEQPKQADILRVRYFSDGSWKELRTWTRPTGVYVSAISSTQAVYSERTFIEWDPADLIGEPEIWFIRADMTNYVSEELGANATFTVYLYVSEVQFYEVDQQTSVSRFRVRAGALPQSFGNNIVVDLGSGPETGPDLPGILAEIPAATPGSAYEIGVPSAIVSRRFPGNGVNDGVVSLAALPGGRGRGTHERVHSLPPDYSLWKGTFASAQLSPSSITPGVTDPLSGTDAVRLTFTDLTPSGGILLSPWGLYGKLPSEGLLDFDIQMKAPAGIAVRLVANGERSIVVTTGGWDHHKRKSGGTYTFPDPLDEFEYWSQWVEGVSGGSMLPEPPAYSIASGVITFNFGSGVGTYARAVYDTNRFHRYKGTLTVWSFDILAPAGTNLVIVGADGDSPGVTATGSWQTLTQSAVGTPGDTMTIGFKLSNSGGAPNPLTVQLRNPSLLIDGVEKFGATPEITSFDGNFEVGFYLDTGDYTGTWPIDVDLYAPSIKASAIPRMESHHATDPVGGSDATKLIGWYESDYPITSINVAGVPTPHTGDPVATSVGPVNMSGLSQWPVTSGATVIAEILVRAPSGVGSVSAHVQVGIGGPEGYTPGFGQYTLGKILESTVTDFTATESEWIRVIAPHVTTQNGAYSFVNVFFDTGETIKEILTYGWRLDGRPLGSLNKNLGELDICTVEVISGSPGSETIAVPTLIYRYKQDRYRY